MSSKLRATLKRIRENLIHVDDVAVLQSDPVVNVSINDDRRDRVAHPHISPAVDLNSTDTLYGLTERIVATESLLVFMKVN